MLAVCDGGSTKADWKVRLDDGLEKSVTTTGFNPNYISGEEISKLIKSEMSMQEWSTLSGRVYYYGTGCSDIKNQKIVTEALKQAFSNAEVMVGHDLLGAARATCGHEAGIVCILGTGSNSVLFDGENEIDNITNLGFLLGDEGSGAQIGKRLVQAYFYREMPKELHPLMEQACPEGRKTILEKIYGGGIPAAYLATYVKLFAPQRDHPFVRDLIKSCFNEFLTRHVCKYKTEKPVPVHFVGSVAFHFQDILLEALTENKLIPGIFIKRPIDNLLTFHETLVEKL
jgi:N-acetylglucosamine kinase-like BadF-type ATPase